MEYVDNFEPFTFMDIVEIVLLDENNRVMTETRYIDTFRSVRCRIDEEAKSLLNKLYLFWFCLCI